MRAAPVSPACDAWLGITQDSQDPNPLIRALAVRTMGCIRVDKITEYLCDPLQRCLKVCAGACMLVSHCAARTEIPIQSQALAVEPTVGLFSITGCVVVAAQGPAGCSVCATWLAGLMPTTPGP